MIYLGRQIRQYRLEKGLNSQEFADRICITKNYLDKLESTSQRTRKEMNQTLLVHICRTFQDFSLFDEYEKELYAQLNELRNLNICKIS